MVAKRPPKIKAEIMPINNPILNPSIPYLNSLPIIAPPMAQPIILTIP